MAAVKSLDALGKIVGRLEHTPQLDHGTRTDLSDSILIAVGEIIDGAVVLPETHQCPCTSPRKCERFERGWP